MSAAGIVSKEERVKLAASGTVNPAGEYEIVAITAGNGNGWQFGVECLYESLSLWDGAECFVDHAIFGHSVKDLAGVCHSPVWDEESQGVAVKLRAVGPSAGLLVELAKELLSEGPKPRVGFSADVVFTARGKKVEKILRVLSVDLVFNPARGGAFKRALNSIRGSMGQPVDRYRGAVGPEVIGEAEVLEMSEEILKGTGGSRTAPTSTEEAQLQSDRQAVRLLLDEQNRQEELSAETNKARQVRAEMCGYLLESALVSSRLPAPIAERVRRQFSGKVFEPAELTAAVEDARQLIGELTAGATVVGPGRISGMFSSEDQIQAAVDDLFGVERSEHLKGMHPARLSGIRELYMMLTGDYELHGGYHPGRVQLATTADFAGLVKNALNKIVVNQWTLLGRAGYDWWRKIAAVEHFNSLQSVTGTLVGTVGELPVVAEAGPYTELEVGDSPETASFVKYGGYIPMTLELIDRDETRKLKAYPRELASAGLRNISKLVAAIFTEASGAGPLMADTGRLFNATAVTTGGGHANLLTTALSGAAWEAACAAVYNQPMLVKNGPGTTGDEPKMAVNPRYCLVPRALQLAARKILYPVWENAANIHSENQQQGQVGDVITVPEWTDSTDWAAVVDPAIAPAIYVGERFGLMPEIFIAGNELNPAVFTNDEHRLKVRHFLAVWVNDFRPLHKSNVSG
jgi:hypothetical protein